MFTRDNLKLQILRISTPEVNSRPKEGSKYVVIQSIVVSHSRCLHAIWKNSQHR